MKKLLKIFVILLAITLTFSINLSVFATSTDEATDNNSILVSSTSNSSSSSSSNGSNSSSTSVSSVPSINEDGLSISDILNILLIATGVVIVLLAIAIFVKLK